jgi:hypothetical protein
MGKSHQAELDEVLGGFAGREFSTREAEEKLREPPYRLSVSNAHKWASIGVKTGVVKGALRKVRHGVYVHTRIGQWLTQEVVLRDTSRAIGNEEATIDWLTYFPWKASDGIPAGIAVAWKNPPPSELFFGMEFDDVQRANHPLVRPERMFPRLAHEGPKEYASRLKEVRKFSRRPLARATMTEYVGTIGKLRSLLSREPALGRYILRDLIPEILARTPAVIFAYPVRLVRLPRSQWGKLTTLIGIPAGQPLPKTISGSVRFEHRPGIKEAKILQRKSAPAYSIERGLSAAGRSAK